MVWVSSNTPARTTWPLFLRLFGSLAHAGVAWLVVLASLALCAIGVHAIDIGAGLDSVKGGGLHSAAMKQVLLGLVGVAAAGVVALPSHRMWGQISLVFMLVMVGLLVFLLIPFVPKSIVTPRNGARGWINLGAVDFQPAELAKVAYVLTLAWYMRYSSTHRTFRGLLPPAIITGVPVLLITLEPDLGTACLFIPVLFAVLVAAGARLKHLAIIVLVASLAAPAAYPILKPHQQARIKGMIQQIKGDTSSDQDINMQSVTAQRLIGAGQGAGVQDSKSRALVHFSRLPERHNDMIFAVISNRYGFVGVLGLFTIYLLWIGAALLTAASIREPFARLVIVGFAAFMATQLFVNVGMNIGILPIIGITLPFVSYGGSSMVTAWIMVGLIMGIAVRRPSMPTRRSFEYADDER
jgi:cell division protein FtsW (lipid II flippase)